MPPKTKRKTREFEKLFFGSGKGSLSRQEAFAKAHPEISEEKIEEFYQTHPVVRQFYRVPRPQKKRLHTVSAPYPMAIVQIDLLEMRGYNPRFYLIGCDIFSRYGFLQEAPSKSSSDMIQCMTRLMEEIEGMRILPGHTSCLISDRGTEFFNAPVRQLIKDSGTFFHHAIQTSASKAQVVERLNRTLRQRVAQLSLQVKAAMPQLFRRALKGYNESCHSALGPYTPAQAARLEPPVRDFLLQKNSVPTWEKVQENRERLVKNCTVKVGDFVNFVRLKPGVFSKSSARTRLTNEIFYVDRVKLPSAESSGQSSPMFRLLDLDKAPITGVKRRHKLEE